MCESNKVNQVLEGLSAVAAKNEDIEEYGGVPVGVSADNGGVDKTNSATLLVLSRRDSAATLGTYKIPLSLR